MTKSEAINMYLSKWDTDSKDRVIANIGLAIKMAMPYFDRLHYYPNQDIMQQAIFGLYEASKRFDPNRGVAFSTYATPYIKGYIRQVGRTKAEKLYNKAYRLTKGGLGHLLCYSKNIDDEDQLEFLIKCLDNREKQIIKFRFGLDGSATYSLEEIGNKIRLSRERVRQIEQIALKKMRDFYDCNKSK